MRNKKSDRWRKDVKKKPDLTDFKYFIKFASLKVQNYWARSLDSLLRLVWEDVYPFHVFSSEVIIKVKICYNSAWIKWVQTLYILKHCYKSLALL